jgi:excisionase family DNA binding protein
MPYRAMKYPLLTTTEVARLLRVSRRTVCLWAEYSELPGFKIGCQWRFREDQVDTWMETMAALPSLQTERRPNHRPLTSVVRQKW